MFFPKSGFYYYLLIEVVISYKLYHLLFSSVSVKENAFLPFFVFIVIVNCMHSPCDSKNVSELFIYVSRSFL